MKKLGVALMALALGFMFVNTLWIKSAELEFGGALHFVSQKKGVIDIVAGDYCNEYGAKSKYIDGVFVIILNKIPVSPSAGHIAFRDLVEFSNEGEGDLWVWIEPIHRGILDVYGFLSTDTNGKRVWKSMEGYGNKRLLKAGGTIQAGVRIDWADDTTLLKCIDLDTLITVNFEEVETP